MPLSPAFDLGLGPLTVAQLAYQSPLAEMTTMRGPLPLAVPVGINGVPAALPAGKRLWFGVKLPDAIKGDWLALCELVQPTDSAATASYIGTLLLNNLPIRAAMHADVSDEVPVLLTLACLAEIFYTDADGVSNAVPGQNFSFKISSPLVNGTEGIAPNPNPTWPTATTVAAAVALTPALTALLNLYAAGYFLFAPLSCDFGQPRNAFLA